jgi:hypothetical protein
MRGADVPWLDCRYARGPQRLAADERRDGLFLVYLDDLWPGVSDSGLNRAAVTGESRLIFGLSLWVSGLRMASTSRCPGPYAILHLLGRAASMLSAPPALALPGGTLVTPAAGPIPT